MIKKGRRRRRKKVALRALLPPQRAKNSILGKLAYAAK